MLPASWGRGAKANVLLLAQASALLSVPFPKEFRTDTSKKDKPESQYLSFWKPPCSSAQYQVCLFFSPHLPQPPRCFSVPTPHTLLLIIYIVL